VSDVRRRHRPVTKAGCAGSILNLLQIAQFNHQVEITRGVLEEDCSGILSDFFRTLRQKKDSPVSDFRLS
jgi:tRNA(adenine34) deaminase